MKKIITLLILFSILATCIPALDVSAKNSETKNSTVQLIEEGSVLLKNDNNVLPLSKGKKIALFGITQISTFFGGDGSAITPAITNKTTILQGLQQKASEGKIQLYQDAVNAYNDYYNTASYTLSSPGNFRLFENEMVPSDSLIGGAAAFTDTAVFVLGRYTQEGQDHTAAEGDYYLSSSERSALNKLKDNFANVIVVINAGGSFDTAWIKSDEYGVDAALICWLPGMFAGDAVANMLCGDSYPSGKLSDTYALSYNYYPSSDNFRKSAEYENFEEDIFVGYRYFETFDPTYSKVAYEFGYGLGYTTFDISNVTVETTGTRKVNISATVTNTGSRPGKEVVQVYLGAPQGTLGKAAKVLCGFVKTDELSAGMSQTVNIPVTLDDFASYDDAGRVQKSAYILESGDYNFYVGNSIKNAGTAGVRGTYNLTSTVIVQQMSQQVAPTSLPRRLLANGSYEDAVTLSGGGYTSAAPTSDLSETVTTEWVNNSKAAKVNTSSAAYIPYGQKTTIQAESCENRHNAVLYDGYVGGFNLDYTSTTYTVYAQRAGRYEMTFNLAGTVSVENALEVRVVNTTQNTLTVPFTATSGWEDFVLTNATGYITLQKGRNTLSLISTGNPVNVDWFTLQAIDDYPEFASLKTVGSTGIVKIEAENFDQKTAIGNGEYFTDEGYSGLSMGGVSGECFWAFGLDAAVEGSYILTLRLASRDSSSNSYYVNINGQKQVDNQPFTATGISGNEWHHYTSCSFPITLERGKNILHLYATGNHPFNFDYFTLESLSCDDCEAVEIKPNGINLLQAENARLMGGVYSQDSKISGFTNQNVSSFGYKLDVQQGGSYDVSINYTPGVYCPMPFYVYVNDQRAENNSICFLSNKTISAKMRVDLDTGVNTLLFVTNVPIENLSVDSINLELNRRYLNGTPVFSNSTATVNANDAFFCQNPFFEFPDQSGMPSAGNLTSAIYEYYIDVEKSGKYTLTMSMASGADSDAGLLVSVDASNEYVVDCTNRSGWHNYNDMQCTVNLLRGKHNIRVSAAPGKNACNFRYFKLDFASSFITLVDVYNGSVTMDAFLDGMTDDELCGLASGSMNDINVCAGAVGGFLSQYTVTALTCADASSGIRTTGRATQYPCGALIACTWNIDLIRTMGENMGNEMVDDGVAILLGPGMNIHRNPLCGRNFEYYSEDPYLTGITASYMVLGIQSKGVGACLKHFAANTREAERSTVDCRISERALREIYLKGFEICVKKAQPWSVMSSYNKINGTETAESYGLLTAILRNEWGFDGFVMSDYWNDSDIVRMVNAGNNVMMPWDTSPGRNTDEKGNRGAVRAAYNAGTISRSQIKKNAAEIMNVVMRYYKFRDLVDGEAQADYSLSDFGLSSLSSLQPTVELKHKIYDFYNNNLNNNVSFALVDSIRDEFAQKQRLISYGNVDGDNSATAIDALAVLQYAVEAISLSESQIIAADVDDTAGVDVMDALRVLQYSVGIINRFASQDFSYTRKVTYNSGSQKLDRAILEYTDAGAMNTFYFSDLALCTIYKIDLGRYKDASVSVSVAANYVVYTSPDMISWTPVLDSREMAQGEGKVFVQADGTVVHISADSSGAYTIDTSQNTGDIMYIKIGNTDITKGDGGRIESVTITYNEKIN